MLSTFDVSFQLVLSIVHFLFFFLREWGGGGAAPEICGFASFHSASAALHLVLLKGSHTFNASTVHTLPMLCMGLP